MPSQELNKRIENLTSPRAKQVAEILTDLGRDNMGSQSFLGAQIRIKGYLKTELRNNVSGARVEDRVYKGTDGKDHLLQVVNVGEDILNVGGIQTAIESNKVEDTKKSKLREIRNDVVEAVEAVLGKDEVDRLMELPEGKESGQRGREFELRLGGRGMMSGIDKAIEAKRKEDKKNKSNAVQNEEPEVVVTGGDVNERLVGVLERLEGRLGGREEDGMSEEDRNRRRRLENKQLASLEEEMQFKGEMEEVSEVEWLDGLMGKDYEKAQIPARWMLRAPDWMERNGRNESEMMGEWRDVYSLAEGLSYAVVRRRTDGKFRTDPDYIKEIIFGMYGIKEKKLKKYYEEKEFSYGFRNALETLVIDLFEPSDQGIFVFKKREDNNSVDRFMLDSAVYKENLANRLLQSGEFKSLEQAKIMVSIASDFLEMGGQYEVGDSERDVGYASDALRTALRPDVKFGKKLGGGEIWGGPIGMWAMAVAGNDAERAKQLINDLAITPKVLGGSVLNMMVSVEGQKEKKPLGWALLKRENIVFESNANDFYFTWKKDHVMNAVDVWKYVNGDKKLEMRSIADLSNVVSDWRKGLYNAVWGLRKQSKKTGIDFVPKGVLAAAIAGSTTVWPFDGAGGFGTLYMRIDKSDEAISKPSFKDDYVDAGDFIIRNAAQSEEERLWLMDFFGVNKKGANDLFLKAVDYDYVTNGTVKVEERRKVQRERGWKLV